MLPSPGPTKVCANIIDTLCKKSSYFRQFLSDFRFFFGNQSSEVCRKFSARFRWENGKISHGKRRWKMFRFPKNSFLAVKSYIRVIPNPSWVQICISFHAVPIFTLTRNANVDPSIGYHTNYVNTFSGGYVGCQWKKCVYDVTSNATSLVVNHLPIFNKSMTSI